MDTYTNLTDFLNTILAFAIFMGGWNFCVFGLAYIFRNKNTNPARG